MTSRRDALLRSLIMCSVLGVSACSVSEAKPSALPADAAAKQVPFAWPFLEPERQAWRGGTTQGKAVELDKNLRPSWHALREEGISPQERDRRAILAMAGEYRVSFQFVETFGASEDPNYLPPAPYFSWGTEYVHVLSNEPDFVQLQHVLVMYFDDPQYPEAMVMKHWRQDWRYRDADLLSFKGKRAWGRDDDAEKAEREGYWTQAVFQVDDSPRYETFGRWVHTPTMSRWRSAEHARPLPRREFSVREDYDALVGRHLIRILPYGWVHEQTSEKRVSEEGRVIAGEIGVNRYEAIQAPALAPAARKYLEKTGPYWAAVREAWSAVEAAVFETKTGFSMREKVEGKKLWEHHFEMAGKVEKGEADLEAARGHALQTVRSFVVMD